MKILLYIKILFVLILLNSCSNKNSKESRINYIKTIVNIEENNKKVFNAFVKSFQATLLNIETEDVIKKNNVDSLSEAYKNLQKNISASMSKIDTLEEIDEEINLKEKSISFYKNSNDLLKDVPETIKNLKLGIENLSEQKKAEFILFIIKSKIKISDLLTAQENWNNSASEFQEKHKISKKEINNKQ